MIILFRTKRLRKQLTEDRAMIKVWGKRQAAHIRRRLEQFKAAETLEVLGLVHRRCHELKGDREGQLSADVEHPYRLIFEAANDPVPSKDDGGLDWSRVTTIRILGVEDTHG